ncbi:MAG: SDR family NAD(P)-dependent oxidoreductase [Sphaerotilus natans subsp. sulfidivorans]|uniref:SDR family oxidoreductase n=1 Tax=Sphaerotilus sulfidivorans TaxID=639200 RepID=UPI002356F43F|nr:SDR family NAD(P)-dependent oxidoreductase [Sphaerotilus sulfidivorans]MCK6401352.1 SDR family NAD(P)-dependent oxidoreductase [Sphaerotilus sulfidivorans]
MKDIAGKVAFVTGAAAGIGLAITRVLLERGANVVMADRQRSALDGAVAALGVPESRVLAVELDVRDSQAMARAAAQSVQAFGRVHLLCNNAGVGGINPMLTASIEEWRWVLDVNLFGAIHGVQHFLPLLQSHDEGGHIVNTCSMASFLPPPPFVPGGGLYCTSKFALRGYTESLRVALAESNIGVTGVYPAMVATDLDRTTAANSPSALAAGVKLPPPGQPTMLQQMGISADIVGRAVVDAIQAGAPSVFTHDDVRPVLADQFERLLATFPCTPGAS